METRPASYKDRWLYVNLYKMTDGLWYWEIFTRNHQVIENGPRGYKLEGEARMAGNARLAERKGVLDG